MANRYTEKTAITYSEYCTLAGLFELAKRHNRALDEIEKAAGAITGESDGFGYGCTTDAVYDCHYTPDELLRNIGIEVIDDG